MDPRPGPPALNDTDPMPFGKHKGIKMANVDPEYLVYYLFDQPWIGDWPQVEKYIEDNFDVIMQQANEQRRAAGHSK